MNNVAIVGRMTKDADLRYTGSGIGVASFTVAVERPFTNAQGERETDFINCVAWRKTAEVVANFTSKGSLVGVTGRIQTRNYTNNEGRKVYITEIMCDNFQMLEPKSVTEARKRENDSGTGQQSTGGWTPGGGDTDDSEDKTNKPKYASFDKDPFESNNESIEISDDDLPF